MQWTDAALAYLTNPERFWPDGRRQPEILLERGIDPAAIVDLAEQRRQHRPMTAFVVNCGGSGSHWLELLMTAAPRVRTCGEVYLPQDIECEDMATLWDAVHLAHADAPAVDSILVNSAHQWRPFGHATNGHSILLLRDPLEIVLSRTFRKPDLRGHAFGGLTDAEYLEVNIEVVSRFFLSAAARKRKPHQIVRYEDIKADAGAVAMTVLDPISPVDAEAAKDAVRRAEEAKDDPERAHAMRYYTGPAVPVPETLRARAVTALHEARTAWGYR